MYKSSSFLFITLMATNIQLSHAELTPMSAADMDRLTAGSADRMAASGGAVIGNDSSAKISSLGTVTLDSQSQEGAKALNLVNSSESTVANGLNIWDGQNSASGINAPGNKIEQSNSISQDQRRVASLPTYNRPEANIEESWSNTGSASSASTHNELNKVTDLSTTSSSMTTDVDTHIDAQSKIFGQEIKAGKGVAMAGQVDVELDAGKFEITLAAGLLGIIEGEAKLTLDLPKLEVHAEGAGCAVLNGSCDAKGTTDRVNTTHDDNSTHYALDTSSDSSEAYTEVGAKLTRSAFEIEGALGEYIVVDNSTLDVTTDYSVNLSGAAQAGLNALNVVNAAGSAV
ncbi:MAG: hypothetical protein OEY89_07815, partial [Gammaproteobacteria bacterium]|nr:hypothetical protein [Gammaproteobacteria bacterium]